MNDFRSILDAHSLSPSLGTAGSDENGSSSDVIPGRDGESEVQVSWALRKSIWRISAIILNAARADPEAIRLAVESLCRSISPEGALLSNLRPHLSDILKVSALAAKSEAKSRGRILSHRETQIVTMIARGMTNKGIAQRLGIAPETVKAHNKNIFKKLNCASRAQAVAEASRQAPGQWGMFRV
jgi:DNA-binding NarL/FixJ family response regulator